MTDEESLDDVSRKVLSGFGVEFDRVRQTLTRFTQRPVTPAQIVQIVSQILSRAKDPPARPTGFVVTCIENDWPEWQQFLDEDTQHGVQLPVS